MSAPINDGGPAFPVPVLADEHGNFHSTHQWGTYMEGGAGMTLRDWFAGQALAGEMSTFTETDPTIYAPKIATLCYALADAMLAAREKKAAGQ